MRVRPPGRGVLWVLLLGAVVAVGVPFLVGPAVFGVMALVVLVGCPFVISCCLPDDGPPS